MKLILIFVLMSIALMFAVAEASDLFGVVRFQGKPLSGAEMSVKGDKGENKVKTNDKGYYSLRNLDPGNYTITIQMPDKSTKQDKVHVFPQNTEKNIDLK